MDWADYLRDQAAKYRQLAETAEGLSVNGDDRRAPFASALVNSTQFKRWQPIRGAARGWGRNRSGPRELNEDQIDGAGDRDDENPAGSARGVGRRTGQDPVNDARRDGGRLGEDTRQKGSRHGEERGGMGQPGGRLDR